MELYFSDLALWSQSVGLGSFLSFFALLRQIQNYFFCKLKIKIPMVFIHSCSKQVQSERTMSESLRLSTQERKIPAAGLQPVVSLIPDVIYRNREVTVMKYRGSTDCIEATSHVAK